jgi:mRNA-degrading endonuclease toxin of MazEF toxin-antitoxin module
MKRYAVHWVLSDAKRGAQGAKTRPCVIVSLGVLNERLQTVTMVP